MSRSLAILRHSSPHLEIFLLSLGIAVIGVRFLLAPATAAAGYGVPLRPDALTPAGPARVPADQGCSGRRLGLFIPVLIGFGQPHALAMVMLTTTLTPLADAAIVLRHGGPRAVALGVHFATAVVMILDAVLLLVA